MTNRHYKIIHKTLSTEYRLKAHNGSLKLFDLNSDQYIRTINESYLKEWYTIYGQLPIIQKLYDICYWQNGSLKETIPVNGTYAVCVSKINQLKNSSHKNGLLRPALKS